jgi:hypothetical protein|tara:strand:- start:142 stop:327 length:186 start_codon:yes stop_codon:yes gene_type:complete
MSAALEKKRITYINDLMNVLHSNNAEIYESLCDREYEETKKAIKKTQLELKLLMDSLHDDF